jgi:rsbT co-antagonist protein RsbR
MNEARAYQSDAGSDDTHGEVARLLAAAGLDADDRRRLVAAKDVIEANLEDLAAGFYEVLKKFDEAAPLLKQSDLLAEAKRLKIEHLRAMVSGNYDEEYVQQRRRLGAIYGRVNLEIRVFLAAFRHMMNAIGREIMKRVDQEPNAAFETFMSLTKVGFLDVSIIMESMIAERERTIRLQQDAIRELSTPVLRVREQLLILPIIGVIDTFRARQLTDSLLHAIRADRAKVAVMDVTGVAAVDSKVANHLIQTVAAARLMGAIVIVTGLSADVAQALVALGVDLRALNTVGDLQGGLELAEQIISYKGDVALMAR